MNHLRIIFDGARPGAVNMDRDTHLLRTFTPGEAPILRLYRWEPAAVSIGYNQKDGDFDTAKAAAAGLDVVQRPTGGRAILHADELTYAVVGPTTGPLFGDSLNTAYSRINEALLDFLVSLGVDAEISTGESREDARSLVCFKSAGKHEIRVQGRKIIGSAQRRTGGAFLQHGSILSGPRHLQLPGYLRPGTRGSEMTPEQLALATTDLGRILGRDLSEADYTEMDQALARSFCRVLDLPPVEMAYADL